MAEKISPTDAARLMATENVHTVVAHVARDGASEEDAMVAFAAVMVAMVKEIPWGGSVGVEYAADGTGAMVIRMVMPPDQARKWEIALACEQALVSAVAE